MRYRALATDYDGTLAERGLVDAPTWGAIARWRATGRSTILVTGRELEELFEVCPRIELFDRVVAENGALLYRPGDRSERMLAPRPPDRFVGALQAKGVGPISVGRAIVAAWEPHRPAIEETIREMGLDLQVIPNKRALMVLPPGVDKASGLAEALRELGISIESTVGVGDAENDLAMLDACGFAAAVANALPEVKRRADLVTSAGRGAGVAELIGRVVAGTLPARTRPARPDRLGHAIRSDDRPGFSDRVGFSVQERGFAMTSALREIEHERIETSDSWPRAVTPDLAYFRAAMVNLYFSGLPGAGDRDWVLIDAGLPGFAHAIADAASRRFSRDARPSAIILTHGHFDHIGSLKTLAEAWDAPIFAHELELPYLTGRSAYPPPDPTVGGGIMPALSWMFPPGPFDFGDRIRPLPADGSVPFMPGWRWIHTPGHTHGHVSLFRDSDRTLIAGDAFVATKQESALAILEQRREIHGPPMYYTSDWQAARRSVEELAKLEPALAVTGHGLPLSGDYLRDGLHALARDFDRVAVPEHGRYARRPAIADAGGVVSVPPEKAGLPTGLAFGLGAGLLAGLVIGSIRGGRGRS